MQPFILQQSTIRIFLLFIMFCWKHHSTMHSNASFHKLRCDSKNWRFLHLLSIVDWSLADKVESNARLILFSRQINQCNSSAKPTIHTEFNCDAALDPETQSPWLNNDFYHSQPIRSCITTPASLHPSHEVEWKKSGFFFMHWIKTSVCLGQRIIFSCDTVGSRHYGKKWA